MCGSWQHFMNAGMVLNIKGHLNWVVAAVWFMAAVSGSSFAWSVAGKTLKPFSLLWYELIYPYKARNKHFIWYFNKKNLFGIILTFLTETETQTETETDTQ